MGEFVYSKYVNVDISVLGSLQPFSLCRPPGNLLINLFFMVNVGIRVAKNKTSGSIYESPLLFSPADLLQLETLFSMVYRGLMVRDI